MDCMQGSPGGSTCDGVQARFTRLQQLWGSECEVHQVAAPAREFMPGSPGSSNCEGVNVRFTRWQQYYHDVWCGRTADCDGSFFSILGWLLPYVTKHKTEISRKSL